MKAKKIQICDAMIHPGEKSHLALPLPESYACSPMFVPIKVVHGTDPGPCVVLLSAMKGDELNGIEIINRLTVDDEIAQSISGTLIAVPVLNVYHLTSLSKALPAELDISKCFPGSETGAFGERIARVFSKEILSKADYCVELKTGGINHDILPQIHCNLENEQMRNLARKFNAPVIAHVSTKNYSLRKTTEEMNIPLLVYEAGEAGRFNQDAIELGFHGIKSVMRYLEMLPPAEGAPTGQAMFSRDHGWIRSPKGGILHTHVELGAVVHEGDGIGHISDPFGSDDDYPIKSHLEGIVVGINRHPLLFEGQTTFKIASFMDNEKAELCIGEWEEKQPETHEG